jgi:hypothetical protein
VKPSTVGERVERALGNKNRRRRTAELLEVLRHAFRQLSRDGAFAIPRRPLRFPPLTPTPGLLVGLGRWRDGPNLWIECVLAHCRVVCPATHAAQNPRMRRPQTPEGRTSRGHSFILRLLPPVIDSWRSRSCVNRTSENTMQSPGSLHPSRGGGSQQNPPLRQLLSQPEAPLSHHVSRAACMSVCDVI